MNRLVAALLIAASCLQTAFAAPLQDKDIPDVLKPWVGWVLGGDDPRACPLADASGHDRQATRRCIWISATQLDLDAAGGRFSLEVRAYADGWARLPGGDDAWPQAATVDGKDVPVVMRDGAPAVRLTPGAHLVAGRYVWPGLPQALQIAADSGLVDLKIDGHPVAASRDVSGRLWLAARGEAQVGRKQHLGVQVFRLIDDGVPMRMTTRIQLEVAGEVRDEVIGPVLPPDFVATNLAASLPARLDDEGRLHVQVRPGLWTLTVAAHSEGPVAAVGRRAAAKPWPDEEIWSFRSHPELRTVEVGGASRVDPQQTAMPENWRQLPAFVLRADDTLTLAEKQRGLGAQEPDRLALRRQLWMDFDGSGYTLLDDINGALRSATRIDAAQPIAPGRILVAGVPRMITRPTHAKQDSAGVEIRDDKLSMQAESRIDSATRRLPVSGWSAGVQSVATTLHLPPGYRLLGVGGADHAPDTWLAQWNLLAVFIVLVLSTAALRLFGWPWAALTLLALVITWHEPGAPHASLISLMVAVALLRAVPEHTLGGRLPRWLSAYRWLSLAVVLIVFLPFAVQQLRAALFPQLETRGSVMQPHIFAKREGGVAEDKAQSAPAPQAEAGRMQSAPVATLMATAPQESAIRRFEPDALTQTGPGTPDWRWRTARLEWNGTVAPQQPVRLWISPPWLTRLMRVLGPALLVLMILSWLEWRLPPPRTLGRLPAAAAGVLLLLSLASMLAPAPAFAQSAESAALPGKDMLGELKGRLLEPPECAPACAQISRMAVDLEQGVLSIRLTVEAGAATSVALPVPAVARQDDHPVWVPATVRLDGADAVLGRSGEGMLTVAVGTGRHDLLLRGAARDFGRIDLPLPLRPHLVSVSAPGWLVTGIDARNRVGDAIQLLRRETRDQPETSASKAAGTQLPPLLVLQRHLHMDKTWDLSSTLRRDGARDGPLVTEVALLPGEQVTGAAVRVADGRAQVSFAPGQASVSWSSRLPVTDAMTWTADARTDRVETWTLAVSPLWQFSVSGLSPVARYAGGRLAPEYRPWPGESITIHVSRPAATKGPTLTLIRAALQSTPRAHETPLALQFSLRSSQGGQHRLPLPPGLSVLDVKMDGRDIPRREEDGALVLPVEPGEHDYALQLRQDSGTAFDTRTPALDLGLGGVNARLTMVLPNDRWILWLGGPSLGPAILFWAVLIVLLVVAIGLSRTGLTPLRTRHWVLLLLGLSVLPLLAAAIVVAWLMALALRGRMQREPAAPMFNAVQAGLILLTVLALAALVVAVGQGLLVQPDMMISGNQSSVYRLQWYQDRWNGPLPQAWVISVSLWVYRLVMLAWALWLANALIGWLRWGWSQFTTGGIWYRKAVLSGPGAGSGESK